MPPLELHKDEHLRSRGGVPEHIEVINSSSRLDVEPYPVLAQRFSACGSQPLCRWRIRYLHYDSVATLQS